MNRSCGLWDPFRAHNPQACHRKGTVFRSIQPVLSVMRASWRPHTLYFAASGVGAAASLALPVLLDRAIESAFDDHRAAATTGWTVAALAAALLATVVASRAKNASVAAAGAQLRRSLIQQVLDAGLPATQRFRTGDLLARITGNVTVASDMGFALINCVMAALSALGAMLALLYLDWTLALAYAAGATATAVILWRSTKSATTVYERYQSVQATIVSALDDALTGLGTIHAAGTQERELARITEPLKDLSTVGRRDWAVAGKIGTRINLLTGLTELSVLGLCGAQVTEGRLPVGTLVAAVGYLAYGLQSLSQLSGITHFAHMIAAWRRVHEVAELPAKRAVAEATVRPYAPAVGGAEIALSRVSLRYGDSGVLQECDLRVPAGSELAIVGASGSGKSTLALLAGGLLTPETGTVALAGTPVAPGRVAFAFEQPVMVGRTLGEALTYGRADADAKEVAQACRIAKISDFVDRLPEGLQTPVRSLACSGGELQRLGIARALLQGRDAIVLDDATSSLDTATEAEVTQAIQERLAGTTRIVVARRPATAARADLVAWLDQGRIRELGSHQELWQHQAYRLAFATHMPAREPSP